MRRADSADDGRRSSGLAVLAVAAAMAVGPLTARCLAADAPKADAAAQKAEEDLKRATAAKAAADQAAAKAAADLQAAQKAVADAKAAKEAEAKRMAEAKAAADRAAREAEAKKAAEAKRVADEERRAVAMLEEARRLHEGKNWGGAINKYREFVNQFPKRAEVGAARVGIAMAMVDAPDKDWNAIAGELQQVTALADIPERGRVHYWLGVALRVTGEQMLEGARNAKPEQRKEQTAAATDRLAQAAHNYTIAEAALTAGQQAKPAGGAAGAKELPAALEMAARARAEGAETLARCGRAKEAIERARPFVSDEGLRLATQRPVALLALGRAILEEKDLAGAFGVLTQLAPFDQPAVGLQARCLLARIKAETGERPEAAAEYSAILVDYAKQKKAAEESLRNRDIWRGRALEQRRAEEIARGTPEYILAAAYDGGSIQYDYGMVPEAQAKFLAVVQQAPEGELKQKAQLLLGACLAQAKQAEGERHLRALENTPLGDQALLWIGRLQRGLADPNNPGQAQNQYKAAVATFAKAAEKAQQLAATDPAAAGRRGEILLDQADTLALAKQYKEAAAIYAALAADASNAERAEVAAERQVSALARAGDYAASDAAAGAFLAKYPASMVKASVLFWQADNGYQQGTALAGKGDAAKAKAMLEQAAERYKVVADKYPESAQAGPAKYGLAMSYYRRGDWENAAKYLAAIPEAERGGELALASYYQADCLMKALPESAEDALSAARLSGGLEEVAKLLTAFTGSNDNLPETPEAMLKLADVYQRNAAILADQQEKQKAYQSARETYEKLLQKYPKHPAYAQAIVDRARLMAAVGDVGGAINELNRFRNDTKLAKSEVAPAALVRLAGIMTAHGRAVDAAAMMEKARQQYEPELKADPKRAGQVASLVLAHGLALKESGKAKEAVALFERVAKEFAGAPEAAEASLATIQVRKDEAIAKLKTARNALAGQPLDKPVDAKLQAAQDEAARAAAEIATAFAQHADRIAEKTAGSDLHVRTLRDAAATWRAIGEAEVDAVRRAKAGESLKTLAARLAKAPQIGKSNSVPRPAEVKLASIPMTPAEAKAREYYNKALEANPDSPVCTELRFELAEMHAKRGEAEPAIQLLQAALDKNPPQPQLEFIRVHLGMCQLMKGDTNGAQQQATAALADSAHPVRPAAYLLKGMALLAAKNPGEAASVLVRFQSGADKYQNAGAVTEEGLFRLGQAYAEGKSWAESRSAYERLLARFGGSRFAAEARYGIGWAFQQEKQFDRAVEAYAEVTRKTSGELAAKAQMQVGLCRGEQKRWKDAVAELLVVPVTYDYAEVAAKSSLEAAKALEEMKQPAQAKEVLQRVVHDHPETAWAAEAAKRIKEIQ